MIDQFHFHMRRKGHKTDLILYINKFVDDMFKSDIGCGGCNHCLSYLSRDELKKLLCSYALGLEVFGKVQDKFRLPLLTCLMNGIGNGRMTLISMNSGALSAGSSELRAKPQYAEIGEIERMLDGIARETEFPYEYISILQDISYDFPLPEYDALWEKNLDYLDRQSGKKNIRLSQMLDGRYPDYLDEFRRTVDGELLEQNIRKYENNNFLAAGFHAPPGFQRKQIMSYSVLGFILERKMPTAILIDVQKKCFPYEQPFYNYARKQKLPIIFYGQHQQ